VAGLKCMSEKWRLELAARLGGEPGRQLQPERRVELRRHGDSRSLF
jgi:hypothetical protein